MIKMQIKEFIQDQATMIIVNGKENRKGILVFLSPLDAALTLSLELVLL